MFFVSYCSRSLARNNDIGVFVLNGCAVISAVSKLVSNKFLNLWTKHTAAPIAPGDVLERGT